jgi:ribosomal protein S18 acetylase RimI-like enzyme
MNCIKYEDAFKDSLKEFLSRMYEIMGYTFPPDEKKLDLDTVYLNCIQSGGDFFLLINGHDVIGSIGVKITDTEKGIGEVKRLFVLPEYQGNGFGEMLLTKLIAVSREKGLCLLRLCTTFKSKKAIKLYKKIGFYNIQAYKYNPVTQVYMELKLK